jgi:hypothetical protein
MPRKQRISDLGYRLRRRLMRAVRSRSRDVRWRAAHDVDQQATKLRQLAIYADFVSGKSVDDIVKGQRAWGIAEVEEAIRARGGTA